jgi:hypothetical protein
MSESMILKSCFIACWPPLHASGLNRQDLSYVALNLTIGEVHVIGVR